MTSSEDSVMVPVKADGEGVHDLLPTKQQKMSHTSSDTQEPLGDDKWIENISREIGHDGRKIATQLGYEISQYHRAEIVYPRQPDTMTFMMLRKWWDVSVKIIGDVKTTAKVMATCFSKAENKMLANVISPDYEDSDLSLKVKEVEGAVRKISFDIPQDVYQNAGNSKSNVKGLQKCKETVYSQRVNQHCIPPSQKIEDVHQNPHRSISNVKGSSAKPETLHSQKGVIELRDYQKELAEHALSGENSIIFSKTGSGKTYIAAFIVEEHLKKHAHGKVVFMTPSNVLSLQQYKRLCDLLPEYRKSIFLACGDSAGNDAQMQNLSLMMEQMKVFVATPQILENNFYYEWIPSIESFTMLVFDECHHTQKKEPYNMIMKRYRKLKMSDGPCKLPQIIGLTASLCSDKPNTVFEAKCGIQSLMARMGVNKISTVKQYIEQYNASGNVGKHEQMMLKARDNDPIRMAVTNAVAQIERKVKSSQADVWGNDVRNLLKRVPPERGSQQYFSWVDDLEKKARQNLDSPSEGGKAKFVLTCCEYMKIYNEALSRNVTLPVSSVEDYMFKTYMEKLRMKEVSYNNTERELLTTFQGIRGEIAELPKDSENPNMTELLKKLTCLIESNESAKFMIFVKTRASTEAVASYLTDNRIECRSLTGTGRGSQDEGLTRAEQKKIMDEFRSGDMSGLIATVGDEGLDFPECELIIQYDIVGSATSSVQMKGRSRKGNTYIFAGKDQLDKEVRNEATIALMKEALDKLLAEGVTGKSIEDEMAEIVKQEDMEDFIMEQKKKSKEEKSFEVFCKCCQDFVVSGENIQCFKDNHHVIVDEEFMPRVKTEKLKKEINIEDLTMTEKMFGGKCGTLWGHKAIVNSRTYPMLAVKQVRFVDAKTQESKTFKKWIDVPYIISKLQLNFTPLEKENANS